MKLRVEIEKRYGGFRLRVDFSAREGEPLALLGASGSGKSAALRCISGVDRPDRGRIELDGQVLFDSASGLNLPPQKRRIGHLFQNYALFPHMTALENIACAVPAAGRGQKRRQAQELLASLRLDGVGDLRPRQLSGGQQQRVALARILASRPRAILLDEPFSALDSSLKWQLESELRGLLAQFHGPAVWVSHDLGEVYRSCAQVCVLENGASSPPRGVRELVADPLTVSAARISGCRNLIPVLPGEGDGTVFVPAWNLRLRCAAPWREGASALGIRAGSLHPAAEGEENAFPCQVVGVTEDLSSILASLRPEGAAPDAPGLQMELGKAVWAALPDRGRLQAAVRAEDVLLLG